MSDPTISVTKPNEDEQEEKEYLKVFGLDLFIYAEALPPSIEEAFGGIEADPNFHAPELAQTTEAFAKAAQKAIIRHEKAEDSVASASTQPPPSRKRMTGMSKVFEDRRAKKADEAMRSTMQIPSSVVKPHAKPAPVRSRPAKKAPVSAPVSAVVAAAAAVDSDSSAGGTKRGAEDQGTGSVAGGKKSKKA